MFGDIGVRKEGRFPIARVALRACDDFRPGAMARRWRLETFREAVY